MIIVSLYHPSGSSQCTSPKHPVSCIEPGLATRFIYSIIHVSIPFLSPVVRSTLFPYTTLFRSQCSSPKHPVSCIEPGLATHFIYDIIHISMPFSQIISPSPSPTESKRLFYTSVSLLLSCTQGYCYHLSKFHIYVLVYCIGVFSLWHTSLCIIGFSFIHLIRTD